MNTIQLYFALLLAGSIGAVFLAVRQHKRKMDLLRRIAATAKNIKTTATELEKRLDTTIRFAQCFSISRYENFGRDIAPFGIEPLRISSPYFRITTKPVSDLIEPSDNTRLTYSGVSTPKAKAGHTGKTRRPTKSEGYMESDSTYFPLGRGLMGS